MSAKARNRRYLVPTILLLVLMGLGLFGYRQYLQAQLDGALVKAVLARDVSATIAALDAGANPNACVEPRNKRTWLDRIWDRLRGRKVNSGKGVPVLMVSSVNMERSIPMMEVLIRHGADVNATSPDGNSALYYAGTTTNSKAALCLLQHGANFASQPKIEDKVLFAAIMEEDMELFHELEERHVPLDREDEDGMVPLGLASIYGKLKSAVYILDHGVDIDHVDRDGYTPLTYACSNPNCAVVARELIKRKANVNFKSKRGETALKVARANAMPRDVIQLLLKAGAKQ